MSTKIVFPVVFNKLWTSTFISVFPPSRCDRDTVGWGWSDLPSCLPCFSNLLQIQSCKGRIFIVCIHDPVNCLKGFIASVALHISMPGAPTRQRHTWLHSTNSFFKFLPVLMCLCRCFIAYLLLATYNIYKSILQNPFFVSPLKFMYKFYYYYYIR